MSMSQNLERLKQLLAELFQLDQAELDFGIYRIMNTKREEIVRFLDRDLLPQVREAFQAYEAENRGAVEAELAEAVEKARELGVDPETTQKVKEIRARLAQAVDVTALENEVYSHLYNFFRRYYQEGDFISLRRYKEGVYAIPYEGEEVKLHWANHDQYYIKTSEYLRNYTFKLPSGKRVHFTLVEADTEKDNNRAQNGNERRFILSQEQPLGEENGELVIRFEYRPHPDKAKQADLNAAAVDRILNQTTGFDEWRRELASLRPTEKNANRTLLEKHLADYTARNTFDYFIHKDLGGFLRRELDFYIKNEVMHLDDVESETAPRVEQYLSKIKAIRRIAHKLIDFLAQIENFQKRLWLKKKFVVETQYCVTLDRVPEELYPEIAANDAQREEWVRLFAIDEITGDLMKPRYSKPLTVEFLKANPYLVLDTRHFSEDFKRRLLASFDDLDEQCDGLLIHSENFQALNLLMERYRGQVKCIYIDPPYNTGSDEFIYRDRYQHSSWLTLMDNRLVMGRILLSLEGLFFTHIDEREQARLDGLMQSIFGDGSSLGPFIWIARVGKAVTERVLQVKHEYVMCACKSERSRLKLVEKKVEHCRFSDDRGGYNREQLRQWGGQHDRREDRPTLYFPIPSPFGVAVYPKRPDGSDGCWRASREQVEKMLAAGDLDFVRDGHTGEITVYRKIREGTVTMSAPSNILDDRGTSATATTEIKDLFGDKIFDTAKPISLAQRLMSLIAENNDVIILDFFAGSGTTAHAVINLNREDLSAGQAGGGRRKYILVEMGKYFDTVLVPRIKKVVYSKDWKDGKPVSREGMSHMFNVLRLESYEDTLNNLELKRTGPQQTLLEQQPGFREDYVLRYMLDVETRESPSLLNIDRFEDPFSYKLDIATGTAGETKPTVVDLVETFNYLIGLRVKTIDHVRGVRIVTGTNPQGERVLILWRKTKELDNDALDAWFRRQGYNTRDQEYDVIYVNGDNNLENLKKPDQTWKVRLVEEEFRRLMFEVQDV
jgi:adenine-specific DNA-methyltransferase